MKYTRLDFMPFEDEGVHGSWMVEKMTSTDEGYLSGRAIATNVGVFPYRMADGSIQWELRSAEEVFHPDSVRSLSEKVMTNDHPIVKVTAENSKELQIGFTGNVHQDQYHLAPKITITDKDAIEDVNQGKRALSCGYTTDLRMEAGVAFGIHYDAIQTNIRYNHLAVVAKGRAGDAAVLKLDSIDSLGILTLDTQKKESAIMPKYTLDDVTYDDVPNEVIVVIKQKVADAVQAKKESDEVLATSKAKLSTAEAKADAALEENVKLKADLKEAEKGVSKEAMDVAISARVKLYNAAEKAGVEITKDMDDTAIMKAVIIAVSPAAKEKVDKGDAVYTQTRFDFAEEQLNQDEEDSVLEGDTQGSGDKKKDKKDAGERTPEQAHQDMIDFAKKRSQAKES